MAINSNPIQTAQPVTPNTAPVQADNGSVNQGRESISMKSNTPTLAENLETILSELNFNPALQDELRNSFALHNPLEHAKFLHSLSLPHSMKRELLALKVNQPPPYRGDELTVLINRAIAQRLHAQGLSYEKIAKLIPIWEGAVRKALQQEGENAKRKGI